MTYNYQKLAADRETECAQKAAFFDRRLRLFAKTNWITVLIPSLLGVVAGSTIFSNDTTYTMYMGIAVLVAAILGAIHKGLNCDEHQTECRRLVQAYRGFESRYRTLHQIETANIAEELRSLDHKLAELRESQVTTVEPQ